MSTLNRNRLPVKLTRRTPRRPGAFGAGIPTADPATLAGLSDHERRILDELAADWPPRDAILDESIDPSLWGPWADEFVFEPSPEDEAWAASELNKDSTDYDVISPTPLRDRVRARMINQCLARALTNGTIPLD